MRKRGYASSLSLLATAGMATLATNAFAQWGVTPQPTAPEPAQQSSPTSQAASQSSSGRSGASQSGGITLTLMDTIFTLNPSVRLEIQNNDNIYLTPNNQTSDQILVLTPALQLETRVKENTFRLRMSTAIGQYQKHTSDNYTTTNVNATADMILGTRLRTALRLDHIEGIDPRGSTNDAFGDTPNKYRQTYGQAIVSYGAQGAQGRLDLELGKLQRNYLNNRATTAASDREVDDVGATFNWRIGPKTVLLFQAKHSTINYALPSSTLGSVEDFLLAGATWEATAKTRGTFKIGSVKKSFDDATRGNSTQASWTGEVRWSPLTYSHVDLTLNRAPAETTGGVGNFIDRTTTMARWTHEWNSRLMSEALGSFSTDKYQGLARTDNTQKFGAKATYRMRRWLQFGAEVTHTTRDSDDNNFDYKNKMIMLFVYATL